MKKLVLLLLITAISTVLFAQNRTVPEWAIGTWLNSNNRNETITINNRTLVISWLGNESNNISQVNQNGSVSFGRYRISRDDTRLRLDTVYSDGNVQSLGVFIIPVTSISIIATETDVSMGNEITLTTIITPEKASNKGVTWSSSRQSVATINRNGVVRGVAAGETIITARSDDSNQTAQITINVPLAVPTWARGTWSNNDSVLNISSNNFNTTLFETTPNHTRNEGNDIIWFGSNFKISRSSSNNQLKLEVKYSNIDYWVTYTFIKNTGNRLSVPSWAQGDWRDGNRTVTISGTHFSSSIINTNHNISGLDGNNIVWFGSNVKITRNSDTQITASIRQNNGRNLTNYTMTKQTTRPQPPTPPTIASSGETVRVTRATDYQFTPNASGSWIFRTRNNGNSDPTLELLNANGTQRIAINDDENTNTRNSLITHNLTANTRYTVRAGFYNNGSGAYDLVVTRQSAPPPVQTPFITFRNNTNFIIYEFFIRPAGTTDWRAEHKKVFPGQANRNSNQRVSLPNFTSGRYDVRLMTRSVDGSLEYVKTNQQLQSGSEITFSEQDRRTILRLRNDTNNAITEVLLLNRNSTTTHVRLTPRNFNRNTTMSFNYTDGNFTHGNYDIQIKTSKNISYIRNNIGIPTNEVITFTENHRGTPQPPPSPQVPSWAQGTWSNHGNRLTVTSNNLTTSLFENTWSFTRNDGTNTVLFGNSIRILRGSSSDRINLEVKYNSVDYWATYTFLTGSNKGISTPSWALGTWRNGNRSITIFGNQISSSMVSGRPYISGMQGNDTIWYGSNVKITRGITSDHLFVDIRTGNNRNFTRYTMSRQQQVGGCASVR